MTQIDEPTRRQHNAARPGVSTWLSANAGSGKTRVLTDRVARLLLNDVQPQHVLCLTYTKAAASEMQNRLFARLGEWAMLDDDALRVALAKLGLERVPSTRDLIRARTLFARAIETPGGLKIQTIHSFCASLLRRFPLEADVTPQFTEMEDRAADLLRMEVLDQMADSDAAPLVEALARQYTGAEIGRLMQQIVSDTGRFCELSTEDAQSLMGLPPGLTQNDIASNALGPDGKSIIQELVPHLMAKGGNDSKVGAVLQQIAAWDQTALPHMVAAFLTQSGTVRARFPTKPTQDQVPHLLNGLEDLMERTAIAQQQLFALDAADATVTLHRFAHHYTAAYEAAKQARGWLDYDDLINKARQLLSDGRVADWVLYRLDGGIDHILVDEAQDTSPAQWDVIRKLTQEFSSGEGARADVLRTVFVVGDKKQSIYSFQGADPKEFDRMQVEFAERLSDGGQELVPETLDYSFRSSPAILRLVDNVFRSIAGAGFDADCDHYAFHDNLPGRVDLWPVVPKPDKEKDTEWFDPVDRQSPENANRTLAYAIARQIRQMLDDGVLIPDEKGGRPVQPRDFLILVQKRSGIFQDILRACKDIDIDLPIAGSDRLKVGGELAVRDLGALLAFLDTPDDSLALATALRSPLFGWSEQDLFTLAHHRETDFLWEALRKQQDQHPKTVAMIEDLRGVTDFLRPYDLLERILTRHSGRANLLARLGTEAEDGINALLSQALSYERASVPSLTGFLTWMQTDDLEIKRQVDSASNQIRVMTVHGAKGLESPIVILPDCGKREIRQTDSIIELDGTPVWAMPSPRRPARMIERYDEMRAAQQAESMRLLYVALTRAEKWLIVAGAGELDTSGNDWWQRVEAGMTLGGAVDLDTPVGTGKRMQHAVWPTVPADQKPDQHDSVPPLDPLFQRTAPRPVDGPDVYNPSDLGGAKALPGEGLDEETAKAFGTCVHRLLEVLPNTDPGTSAAREAIVRAGSSLPVDLVDQAVAQARAVLGTPELSHIFASDTLAEVPFAARLDDGILRGTIDRLIISQDEIQVFDFKTNRTVPANARECPEGILRQMGAYAAAIEQIYPNRTMTLFILWTHDATLMPIPHDIVREALVRRPYLDGTSAAT
ncbi:MAG: double-strand break repair helicase AddA [Pseudomonadota bacterium]